ncbi:MAG: hypothetical protein QF741_00360 [Candidatus Peribacteraceae bacterium]|nr:hypothetical protein [Candidatus Peribacteraceae bacterium]MDP7645692.1 hypothetical protein [Candidatus Peribacteraceae bacterium]
MTIDHGGEKKAILQIRDSSDSYPGCAQVTFHGKMERDHYGELEQFVDGLRRELYEEAHELFKRASLMPNSALFSRFRDFPEMQIASCIRNKKQQVVTLLCHINDPELYDQIKPLFDAGVLRLVGEDDLDNLCAIEKGNAAQKQYGMGDGLIGMHADEFEVVQSVLTEQE